MTADTVKSSSITTLDGTSAQPPANTQLTSGIGGVGELENSSDYVFATTGGLGSTASTYKMVRLPTRTVVKDIRLFTKAGLDTSTGLAVDLGAYYSDSVNDGTPASLQGTLISANCFVAAVAFGQSSAGSNIDGLSNLDASLRTSPLWQALGLTADPGGYIDIVLAVHTVATTPVAGNVGINVSRVN